MQASFRGEKHCPLLVERPDACIGCPNNPYEKLERKPPRRWLELADAALSLHESVEMGFIRSFDLISPIEWQALRITHEFQKLVEAKQQAELMGAQVGKTVAEILAKVFK